jgi:hypothetical protein
MTPLTAFAGSLALAIDVYAIFLGYETWGNVGAATVGVVALGLAGLAWRNTRSARKRASQIDSKEIFSSSRCDGMPESRPGGPS